MKARTLILNSFFSYKELLVIKRSYTKKIQEVYGDRKKTKNNESLCDYILLLSEICSGGALIVFIIFTTSSLITYFQYGGVRGWLVMLIIGVFVFLGNAYIHGKVSGFGLIMVIKLTIMRVIMFIYRVKPVIH
ncbi:hypothetical protein [Pectobacterium zantedeschiae]|uniref:hypothetical protein n=1 Tax=Pectobacterium zantedeschiae TaxID=2034769 RepID=UPI00101DED2B|nr:hypothetical protein [Pectobacterium zantedeschiae]RYC40401.1 hypothetical protein DEH81_15890 [Pectobacterium zantedeschiae]